MDKAAKTVLATAKAADKFSTPARRRRIIADVAAFLWPLYQTKAAANVHRMRLERAASIQIQSRVRTWLATLHLKMLRDRHQNAAATVVQCAYRSYYARVLLRYWKYQRYLSLAVRLAVIVQSWYRKCRAQQRVAAIRSCREHVRVSACVLIQSRWRTALARMLRTRLLEQQTVAGQRKLHCAIIIQSIWRRAVALRKLERLRRRRHATKVLQKAASYFVAKVKSRQARAATHIQQHARTLICRLRVQKMKCLLEQTRYERLALQQHILQLAEEETERRRMSTEDAHSKLVNDVFREEQKKISLRLQLWQQHLDRCRQVDESVSLLPKYEFDITLVLNICDPSALEEMRLAGPTFVMKWCVAQDLLVSSTSNGGRFGSSCTGRLQWQAFTFGSVARQLLQLILEDKDVVISVDSQREDDLPTPPQMMCIPAQPLLRTDKASGSRDNDVATIPQVFINRNTRFVGAALQEPLSANCSSADLASLFTPYTVALCDSVKSWGQPVSDIIMCEHAELSVDALPTRPASKLIADTVGQSVDGPGSINALQSVAVDCGLHGIDVHTTQCICIAALGPSLLDEVRSLLSSRQFRTLPSLRPGELNSLDETNEILSDSTESEYLNYFAKLVQQSEALLYLKVKFCLRHSVQRRLEGSEGNILAPKSSTEPLAVPGTMTGRFYEDIILLRDSQSRLDLLSQNEKNALDLCSRQSSPQESYDEYLAMIAPVASAVQLGDTSSSCQAEPNQRRSFTDTEYLALLGIHSAERQEDSVQRRSGNFSSAAIDDSITAWFGDLINPNKYPPLWNSRQQSQIPSSSIGKNTMIRSLCFDSVTSIVTVRRSPLQYGTPSDALVKTSSPRHRQLNGTNNDRVGIYVSFLKPGTAPPVAEDLNMALRRELHVRVTGINVFYNHRARLIQRGQRARIMRRRVAAVRLCQICGRYRTLRKWKETVLTVFYRASSLAVKVQSVVRRFLSVCRAQRLRASRVDELRQTTVTLLERLTKNSKTHALWEDDQDQAGDGGHHGMHSVHDERDAFINSTECASMYEARIADVEKNLINGVFVPKHIRECGDSEVIQRYLEYRAWEEIGIDESSHPMSLFDDCETLGSQLQQCEGGVVFAVRDSVAVPEPSSSCWPTSILSLTSVVCPQPESTVLPTDLLIMRPTPPSYLPLQQPIICQDRRFSQEDPKLTKDSSLSAALQTEESDSFCEDQMPAEGTPVVSGSFAPEPTNFGNISLIHGDSCRNASMPPSSCRTSARPPRIVARLLRNFD
jgi:hypothetical protein